MRLAAVLPVGPPAVLQALRVVKDAGLVTDRRDGTRRIYQLDLTGIEELRSYLDRFWNRALATFKEAVENLEGATDA